MGFQIDALEMTFSANQLSFYNDQSETQVYKFPDSSKEIAEICFALSLRSFKSDERYFTISSPLVICCSNFVLIALKKVSSQPIRA